MDFAGKYFVMNEQGGKWLHAWEEPPSGFLFLKKPTGKPKKVAKRGGTEGKGGVGKICLEEEKNSEKIFFSRCFPFTFFCAQYISSSFLWKGIWQNISGENAPFGYNTSGRKIFYCCSFSTYREKVPYFLSVCSFWLLWVEPISINSSRPKMKEVQLAGNSLFYGICKVHLKCHLRTFCRAGMQLIIVGRQQRASSSQCNPDGEMCAFMDKLRHFERRPAGSHCGSKKTFALSSQYQHNTMLSKFFVGIFIIFCWSGI